MLQYSVTLRDNQGDQIDRTVGSGGWVEIRSGLQPENCAARDTGTLLCLIDLPEQWMQPANDGVKRKEGRWEAPAIENGAAPFHFRVKDSAGETHMQGKIGVRDADAVIEDETIAVGKIVVFKTLSILVGNE